MKKWILLSANNVNTEIEAEPCTSLKEAQELMKEEWENTKEEFGGPEEAEISEYGASLFTGGEDGDFYYWQIKEIEV